MSKDPEKGGRMEFMENNENQRQKAAASRFSIVFFLKIITKFSGSKVLPICNKFVYWNIHCFCKTANSF